MLFQYYPMKKNKGITCKCWKSCSRCCLYCQKLNLKAVIFMPVTTPRQKINQVKFFGDSNVEIVLIGDTFDHCLAQALNYTKQHKMNFIDPFNNVYTIAGQGTLAKEILNQAEKRIKHLIMYLLL